MSKNGWLRPSEVHADFDRALQLCGATHRMDIAALSVQIDATGDEYYAQFDSICKLAKAIKVVTLVVSSSELGTPFNEEIERLKKMVAMAELEGAVVALKTEIDTMTEDPDTAAVFCDHVKGLGLTLDPSCYMAGPYSERCYDKLFPYVRHVHLRDSKKGEFHVRVGQGEVDYGKMVTQLLREKYRRCVVCKHDTAGRLRPSGRNAKNTLVAREFALSREKRPAPCVAMWGFRVRGNQQACFLMPRARSLICGGVRQHDTALHRV